MTKLFFTAIEGGVTAARGFLAAGLSCGLKKKGPAPDLALIYSENPTTSAATFTTNKVKAAPVRVSMAHMRLSSGRAIIANSGNANACTGPAGMEHARATAAAVAAALKLRRSEVLVCSTGRIGVPLPVEKIEDAIPQLVKDLSTEGGADAALAIMTSDTVAKEFAVELKLGRHTIRIGGIAKGAGMIDPNMATMLSFITTDASIGSRDLKKALSEAVDQSFNRITVDGDMSTNDTVICLANGASPAPRIEAGTDGFARFQSALNAVTRELALKIVNDGESITKVIELDVVGAATYEDARKAARAIANSILVKCAWHGGDPNWGRIMDALGYSGVRMKEELVEIHYGGQVAVRGGTAAGTPVEILRRTMKERNIRIVVNLNIGRADYSIFTTDLTPGYVRYNMGE